MVASRRNPSRRRFGLVCLAALAGAAMPLTVGVDDAHARRRNRVSWGAITVRKGADEARILKRFAKLLKAETKRHKWGKGPKLVLHARVQKCTWEETSEVAKVRVVVMARIEGGQFVRSQIRIGGRPKNRRKLEREALTVVSAGVVTRLSSIALSASKKREDAAEKAAEKAAESED